MPGIGLRLRFFAIILIVLLLSSAAIVYVHIYFFRDEPMAALDQQIKAASESLLQTPFAQMTDFSNRSAIGRIFSSALGDNRIGKVFLIRDGKKIVFRNLEVPLINENLPMERGWQSMQSGDHYIRLYTQSVPGFPGRILQAGAVLDISLLDWKVIDVRALTFILLVVVLLFLASIGLSFILLSPLRTMNRHLTDATSDLKNLKDVSPLPQSLLRVVQLPLSENDDFAQLVRSVQRLIERINANYRLTRNWTFQMAHELKTPLTLMRTEIEMGQKKKVISSELAGNLLDEVDYISDVITQFLDWADLENSAVRRDIHAVRLASTVKTLKSKLEKIYPDRLQVRIVDDPVVLTNPMHLEQVLNNLVLNSLRYSPADAPVDLLVERSSFRVVDRGGGIPRDVIERLGEPFNFGPNSRQRDVKGNGLGLAWVSSVSRVYDWSLHISSTNRGTDVTIEFPAES